MSLPSTVSISLETLVIGGIMLFSLGAWAYYLFIVGVDAHHKPSTGELLLMLPGLLAVVSLAFGAVGLVVIAVFQWPWLLLAALPLLVALGVIGHFMPDADENADARDAVG